MSKPKSYGDGRRMSLDEARERRQRIIAVHGSLDAGHDHGDDTCWRIAEAHDRDARTTDEGSGIRDWNAWWCFPCYDGLNQSGATQASDVGLIDGVPVAMCERCRQESEARP
jgi:hypothetical protein